MENPDGASTSFDTETLEDCIATNQVRGTSTFHFDFETRSCKTGELNTNGDPYVSFLNETRVFYIKKESKFTLNI